MPFSINGTILHFLVCRGKNHLFKKVVLLPIRPCMSWQKISFLCAFKSLFGICKRIDKEKDAFSNSGTFKMPRTED